jgi:hypothetical protein
MANQSTEVDMQDHLSSPLLANPDALARKMMQCAHNRDGLPEMVMGIGLLAGSGMCWPDVLFKGKPQQAWGLAFSGLVCLICAMGNWLIKSLRQRYLLPWIGYVELRPYPRRKKVLAAVIALSTAIGLGAMALKVELNDVKMWLLPAVGIMFGGFTAIVGRLPRFWITGGLAFCLGIALPLTHMEFELCMALFFLIMGIVELFTGAIVLVRLLHHRHEAGA